MNFLQKEIVYAYRSYVLAPRSIPATRHPDEERNLDDSIESSYLESIRFVYNKTIILYNYKLHLYICVKYIHL